METIQVPGYSESIPVRSIIWLEGDANYTRIHQQGGKVLLVTQSLFSFEHYPHFIRIHRSAIVNPMYVQKFVHQKGRSGWVELPDSRTIPVSRIYLQPVAARLSHLASALFQ